MDRPLASSAGAIAVTPKAISISKLQPRHRVLVVEDEVELADMIAYNLRAVGLETAVVHDGRAALVACADNPPGLVVLDLMLPELGGLEVAKRLRAAPRTRHTPILVLTARGAESDQLSGLGAGVDDYVVKPFSMKVLLARVEALLRRASAPSGQAGASKLVRLGGVSLDPDTYECEVDGQAVTLTLTEFKLLMLLLRADGKVLNRSTLINQALGPGVVVTDRTIDVHITAIRRKLGSAGSLIKTVRGVGYRTASDSD